MSLYKVDTNYEAIKDKGILKCIQDSNKTSEIDIHWFNMGLFSLLNDPNIWFQSTLANKAEYLDEVGKFCYESILEPLTEWIAAKRIAEIHSWIVELSNDILTFTKNKKDAGSATDYDVSSANSKLIKSRVNYLQAKKKEMLAHKKLTSISGNDLTIPEHFYFANQSDVESKMSMKRLKETFNRSKKISEVFRDGFSLIPGIALSTKHQFYPERTVNTFTLDFRSVFGLKDIGNMLAIGQKSQLARMEYLRNSKKIQDDSEQLQEEYKFNQEVRRMRENVALLNFDSVEMKIASFEGGVDRNRRNISIEDILQSEIELLEAEKQYLESVSEEVKSSLKIMYHNGQFVKYIIDDTVIWERRSMFKGLHQHDTFVLSSSGSEIELGAYKNIEV